MDKKKKILIGAIVLLVVVLGGVLLYKNKKYEGYGYQIKNTDGDNNSTIEKRSSGATVGINRNPTGGTIE